MDRTPVNRRGENHLLSLLPQADRQRIVSRCRKVALEIRTVLFAADDPVEHVYFPLQGMVSLVMTSEEGHTIEVGTVGNEGMAGAPLALGGDTSTAEAVVQVAGQVLRIGAKAFRQELKRSVALQTVALRYTQTLLAQISQSLACNHFHPVEKRFCRWLLMTHDRVGLDEMVLTQQFMSQMLGVRRPSVTVVAGRFQEAGLIRYSRGNLVVLDRQGLEKGACTCYRALRRATDRMLAH